MVPIGDPGKETLEQVQNERIAASGCRILDARQAGASNNRAAEVLY